MAAEPASLASFALNIRQYLPVADGQAPIHRAAGHEELYRLWWHRVFVSPARDDLYRADEIYRDIDLRGAGHLFQPGHI